MNVGLADSNGHREDSSGNGVLGCGHDITVMRVDPRQVKIVEGNR
jgi:hypothetical protein